MHASNAYHLANVTIHSLRLKTNQQSANAFRGFGGPQGIVVIEEVIDRVARALEQRRGQRLPVEAQRAQTLGVEQHAHQVQLRGRAREQGGEHPRGAEVGLAQVPRRVDDHRRVRLGAREQEVDRAAQVRNDDRAAHDQPHAERLEELVAVHAGVAALRHVVRNAVVAAQHHRGDEAEQLLRLHVERAGLVGLGVEREEAAHHLVVFREDALVHALAEIGDIGQGNNRMPIGLRWHVIDQVNDPVFKSARVKAIHDVRYQWAGIVH